MTYSGEYRSRWPLWAIAVLLSFSFGCKEQSVTVHNSVPTITSANAHGIVIGFTDYDNLLVTHSLGTSVTSAEITGIEFGTKTGSSFVVIQTAGSSFDGNSQMYTIPFRFAFACDSTLVDFPFTIRYLRGHLAPLDVDTVAHLYQYPCKTAELVVVDSVISPFGPYQDIAIADNVIYAHTFGPVDIYAYDMGTGQSRYVAGAPGGDHIAACSTFLFYDSGNSVWRYDLPSGPLDNRFIPRGDEVCGLAIQDSLLYMLTSSSPTISAPFTLKALTFAGVVVDSSTFNRKTYYMAMYNHVIYSFVWQSNPGRIARYDVSTHAFLSDVMTPVKNGSGFKTSGDTLYYTDYYKAMIGRVPIKDLVPATP